MFNHLLVAIDVSVESYANERNKQLKKASEDKESNK